MELKLAENQFIIKDLNDKINQIRTILLQRQNSQSEQIFDNGTIEQINKIKKIQKKASNLKESQKLKLRQIMAQNNNYRSTIYNLNNKLTEYESKMKEYQQTIDKLESDVIYKQQQNGMTSYDLSLFQHRCSTLHIGLKNTQKLANNIIKAKCGYQQRIFNSIQAIYGQLVENSKQGPLKNQDIIQKIQNYILEQLEVQKTKALTNILEQNDIQIINQKFDSLINQARIALAFSKHIHLDITSIYSTYDQMHNQVYPGLRLRILPFSLPPTQNELKINWSLIRSIKTNTQQYVDDKHFNELIINLGKFPKLQELIIEKCSVRNMMKYHFEDLQKLKARLERVIFKQTDFSEESLKNFEKFKNALSWVDIRNEKKQ